MKTSELIGPALDWAVAKCESEVLGEDLFGLKPIIAAPIFVQNYKPSTDWAHGGPIIEERSMSVTQHGGIWKASTLRQHAIKGPTPLIAAMRCYVASKLGEEIEVPEELK
jgi:Protein of unknown function (DUF2591)